MSPLIVTLSFSFRLGPGERIPSWRVPGVSRTLELRDSSETRFSP